MAQVTGKATIYVDGQQLNTADEATLDTGGVKRTPVIGGGRVVGYSEETVEPELEITVYHTAETSIEDIKGITDATVIFQTDTGKRYVLTGAFVTEPPKLKTKGGELDVKMSAVTCEED
jgi:hypothetical protein